MTNPIRIVLIHPYGLYREGLTRLLSQQQGIDVVVSAARVSEMLNKVESLKPDVIIIDYAAHGRESLIECRQLQRTLSHVKILMIGLPKVAADIRAYIEAGAAGYVPYEATLQELFDSVRKVSAGEVVCSPLVARCLFDHITAEARKREQFAPRGEAHLTKREREILLLLATGLSNKEIAFTIHVAISTVKNHVHNILRKLQVEGRREAARYARQYHVRGTRFED